MVKNVRLLSSHPSGFGITSTEVGQDTLDGKAARSSYKKLALKAGCFVFFGMKHPDDPRSDFQQPPDQARFILIRCQRSGKWMTQNVMTA